MSAIKIKKGDLVKVIAGKDKDKEGKVIAVDHKKGTVTVEGANMITKDMPRRLFLIWQRGMNRNQKVVRDVIVVTN